MKKLMGIGLLTILGMSVVNAQSLEIDFDGTESNYLNQISPVDSDEQTNITSFGRDTTFFAGDSAGPDTLLLKDLSFDLAGGKALSFEATFYNRDVSPSYNEAYLGFGENSTIVNDFNSTGFGIGYATSAGYILNRFYLPPSSPDRIVSFGAVSYPGWHTLKTTVQVVGNDLMLVALEDNGVIVAGSENVVIGPVSIFPWIDKASLAFIVDDTIDGAVISGPAYVAGVLSDPRAIPSTGFFALFGLAFVLLGLARKRFA